MNKGARLHLNVYISRCCLSGGSACWDSQASVCDGDTAKINIATGTHSQFDIQRYVADPLLQTRIRFEYVPT